LKQRIRSPRSRLTSAAKVEHEAAKILAECHASRWIGTEVKVTHQSRFKQAKRGRPGKDTRYVREQRESLELVWSTHEANIQYDSHTDGMFPLIVNEPEDHLSLHDALIAYKHQPHLERRFHECKSILDVMPVLLRNPARIEAFLFVYFIALFVEALIERELRRRMKAKGISSLPLYPEARKCAAPTADRTFSLFGDIRRHILADRDGRVLRRLYDELNPTQRDVLRLLSIPVAQYFADGRTDA
jgi:transposase